MLQLKIISAFFYDFILLLGIWFVTAIPFVIWQGGNLQHQGTATLGFQLYLLAITYLYITFFWVLNGQTPGLRVWKLRIQTLEGYRLNRHQANLRFILGILLFAIGWIGLFIPKKYQTLQDIMAKTEIVSIDKTDP